jgi:hypothetical protein
VNIPAPQKGESSAPQIEDGLYVARFNDIYAVQHDDWKQAKDKFGKVDTGLRFHFNFTLLDEDREPVLLVDVQEGVDDPTKEFQLEALTRNISSHEKANSYALLKGILTASEFAAWVASTTDNPADLSAAEGREVNVQVAHSESGWPLIAATLGAAKPKKALAKA